MLKITWSAISRKPMNQNQKKIVILDNIFLHPSAIFRSKFKIPNATEAFWHLENQHLTAQQTAPR